MSGVYHYFVTQCEVLCVVACSYTLLWRRGENEGNRVFDVRVPVPCLSLVFVANR